MAAIEKLRSLASRKAADPPSAAAVPAAAVADEDDLPIPSDIKTVFLGGLFLLAMLAACYIASEIVLPIVLAFVLGLVLQPAMRVLERVRLPRGIAAMLVILLLFGTLGGLGTALSGPAASWVEKLPTGIPRLQERLRFLSRPIAAFQKFADRAQGLAQGDAAQSRTCGGARLGVADRLLSGIRSFASGLVETVLVLFFFLSAATRSLGASSKSCRGSRTNGRRWTFSQQIESDVSAYLFTITVMNLAVGVATGTVMALCGVGDPLLWGTLAFLLNYIPILGPMMGVVVFLLVGLLSLNPLWMAFLPAGLYISSKGRR